MAGKVALITGGASGIGRATAERFSAEGAAAVVLADIDIAAARSAAAESHGLEAVALDVVDDAAWDAVVDGVLARHGKLDVLVNSAGIAPFADIETCTTAEYRRVMAVNVDGVFFGCRAGVRALKAHGGSIVNLSSVSGLIGGVNTAAYNASKGAVRLLTKSVALHCARRGYGIRCNSVHPTFVETPMFDRALERMRDPERARAKLIASVPLGRMAQPREIADLIVYLASDESQFVTGAEFVIDGGMTAG